jgi:hypothetical protein
MIRLRLTPLTLFAGLPLLWTAPAISTDAPSAATANHAADADLVDFLADWQDGDGHWLDPQSFNDIDPAKVAADDAKRHAKTPAPAPGTGHAAASSGGDTRHAVP